MAMSEETSPPLLSEPSSPTISGTFSQQNEREDSNIIKFTSIKYDPCRDLDIYQPPKHAIYRKPKASEVYLEYFYCLFVGAYALKINPYSINQLLKSVFFAAFWSMAYIYAFYRTNLIVRFLSSILTKYVWIDTLFSVYGLLKSYSAAKKTLPLNVFILFSNVVIYMGMSYSSQAVVKSFDISLIFLIVGIGGFLGMGVRFLFHFVVASRTLVFFSLCTLGCCSIFPLILLRHGNGWKAIKLAIFCCTSYLIAITSLFAFYWTDSMSLAREYIFHAKNNDPSIFEGILNSVRSDIDNGKWNYMIKPQWFNGQRPKLLKAIHVFFGSICVPVVTKIIQLFIRREKLCHPLYYTVLDDYLFDKFNHDVRAKTPSQLITNDIYAERDAIFAVWMLATILTACLASCLLLWRKFNSLKRVHERTIEAMLVSSKERMLIDPDTYSKRIVITEETIQGLMSMSMLNPDEMTQEQKFLLNLVKSGGKLEEY